MGPSTETQSPTIAPDTASKPHPTDTASPRFQPKQMMASQAQRTTWRLREQPRPPTCNHHLAPETSQIMWDLHFGSHNSSLGYYLERERG